MARTKTRSTAKVASPDQKMEQILETVTNLAETTNNLMDRVDALERDPSKDAINNPVVTNKNIEPLEYAVGQDLSREMKSTGPAEEALSKPDIEVVKGDKPKSWYEEMQFMEDVLVVYMHPSSDPTAEPLPYVANGGDNNTQFFIRGQEQNVKRKYVEVLLRSRKTRFTNEKFVDTNGDDAYRYPADTTLAYDFTIRHDPAGDKGKAWLENLLAQ